VKINTVQTILFRQLRELNERRNIKPPAQLQPGKSGMNPPTSIRNKRRAITEVRYLVSAMSRWLTSYYNLCGRTGLDLPAMEPQICSRNRERVIRLKASGSGDRLLCNNVPSASTTTPI
jgi:hypothetical protein